jgi:precorrin isomerase
MIQKTEAKTCQGPCSMLRNNTTKKERKITMKTTTQHSHCKKWQDEISARTNALAGIMRTSAFFVFMALTAMSAKAATIVDLGFAANFVILSKAGISTTGGTNIVGDIGGSPIAATAITGFGLILDPSGQFSTSSVSRQVV